ncbi:unnamed protein product [Diplocarpon coronariae]
MYPNDDQYLATDTVCAVKDDLLLTFNEAEGEPKAKGATLDCRYDVRLLSKKWKPESKMMMANAAGDKKVQEEAAVEKGKL